MDSMIEKKRKKKLPVLELPENVVVQYSRLENLVLHPLSRKWLSYEWKYDDAEDTYFNKLKPFDDMMSSKFPTLKTRKLTATEWCKIRKMLVGRKVRRFSPKFIKDERIKLEKYRQSYRLLEQNKRLDQLVHFNVATGTVPSLEVEQSEHEIYRLMFQAKTLFISKSAIVQRLCEINNVRAEAQHSNGEHFKANANAVEAIAMLQECNREIMSILNKLLCFQLVKDALLFDALKKKKIVLALSPAYFHRMCEVRILESHQDCRSETFITERSVMCVMNITFMDTLVCCEYEQLAEDVECYSKNLVEGQMSVLEQLTTIDNLLFFDTICMVVNDIMKNLSDLLD